MLKPSQSRAAPQAPSRWLSPTNRSSSPVPSSSLILAFRPPAYAHCPATLLTHPLRSLEIKSFPIHGANPISFDCTHCAVHFTLLRTSARSAFGGTEPRPRDCDRYQSRASYPLRAPALATSSPSKHTHCGASPTLHYFNTEGIAGSAFTRHHIVDLTVVVAPHPTPINRTTPQRVREAFACSSPTSGTKQHHIITTIHRYPSLCTLARLSSQDQPVSSSLHLSCSDTQSLRLPFARL